MLFRSGEIGGWLRGRPVDEVFPWNGPPESHDIVDVLKPEADDVVIVKYKPSAFFGTQLASILIELGVDSVMIAGMTTSGCVRATVVDAFSYNLRVTVPVECVADRSQLSHRVSLIDMGVKYCDLLPLDEVLDSLRTRRARDTA